MHFFLWDWIFLLEEGNSQLALRLRFVSVKMFLGYFVVRIVFFFFLRI